MAELNYHHLRYFHAIAHERSLTRAAERLHVSPSALSIQLKQLEQRLGQPLFERRGRQLALTEAGHIALEHADAIFRTGDELVSTLKGRPRGRPATLRIGAVATLSRNFQRQWLAPVLARDDVAVTLHSGSLAELLAQLGAHALDIVLANVAVPRDRHGGWHCRLVAQQPVSLVSRKPRPRARPFAFPEDLRHEPLLLPGPGSGIRGAFDALLQQHGIAPRIRAEVDDMAMLRLLARETGALTLVPPVVVADELAAGTLVERCTIPAITERFYAISGTRRFPHPLLRELDLGASATG